MADTNIPVTPGSAIKAVQEASERICAKDYLIMKLAFLLGYIGRAEDGRICDD